MNDGERRVVALLYPLGGIVCVELVAVKAPGAYSLNLIIMKQLECKLLISLVN